MFRVRGLCDRLSDRSHRNGGKIGFSGTAKGPQRIDYLFEGKFSAIDPPRQYYFTRRACGLKMPLAMRLNSLFNKST
jgi:hypothetical protein